MEPRTTAVVDEPSADRPPADGPREPASADGPRDPASADELTGRLADQLLDLSRRLHRAHRRLMEPLGITPAQARLLRTLAHCDEPPRMADLAQRLDVVPRAVTTLVDALEERGLVRRAPDPDNRRVIRIELLDPGALAVRELHRARRTAAVDLLGRLDDGQRAALASVLGALEDEEPAGPAGAGR
jgi:DNA-binding MarR family transcriptional regulator